MNYKYAFYCSGSASRVFDFYDTYALDEYPFEFIYYDGCREVTFNKLKDKFTTEKILVPDADVFAQLKGKRLSEFISHDLLQHLNANRVDYIFCFGDKLLKPPLIDSYKNKIINFHPSLLPAFPGFNAIDQALNSSVQLIGNTAHFIDSGIDSGIIILQNVIPRSDYVDYHSILGLQVPMLQKLWTLLDNDKIVIEGNKVIIQNESKCKVMFSA